MSTRTTRLAPVLLAALLALGGLLALPEAARAEDGCIEDLGDASRIARENGLAPTKSLASQAAGHVEGQLVKWTLCQEAGAYVYRLVFVQDSGQVVNMTVDARQPFPQ